MFFKKKKNMYDFSDIENITDMIMGYLDYYNKIKSDACIGTHIMQDYDYYIEIFISKNSPNILIQANGYKKDSDESKELIMHIQQSWKEKSVDKESFFKVGEENFNLTNDKSNQSIFHKQYDALINLKARINTVLLTLVKASRIKQKRKIKGSM